MERRFALPEISARWLPGCWESHVSAGWYLWHVARRVLVGCHGGARLGVPLAGPGAIRDSADCVASEWQALEAAAREGKEELRRLRDPRGQDFELDAMLRALEEAQRRHLERLGAKMDGLEEVSRRAARTVMADAQRVIDESVAEARAREDAPDEIEAIGRSGARQILQLLDKWLAFEKEVWFGEGPTAHALEPFLEESPPELSAIVAKLGVFTAESDDLEAYVGQLLVALTARTRLRCMAHVKALYETARELIDDVSMLQSSFQDMKDFEPQ